MVTNTAIMSGFANVVSVYQISSNQRLSVRPGMRLTSATNRMAARAKTSRKLIDEVTEVMAVWFKD